MASSNRPSQDVLQRGGPQIASRYRVDFSVGGASLTTYPFSVIIPGRAMVFYEHDIWGPSRKIPLKRTYTQCQISFVVYQDWTERRFIEEWMNYLVKNDKYGSSPAPNFIPGELGGDFAGSQVFENLVQIQEEAINSEVYRSKDAYEQTVEDVNLAATEEFFADQLETTEAIARENTSLSGDSNPFYGRYNDYANYKNSTGTIIISSINSSQQGRVNSQFILKEAYPASITPMSFSADATGYPTFTATFQYNNYVFG